MTHEEKNIGGRAEHPGSDEQKISELLGGLKRVEAPKDFDFHLKAKIANARPADRRKASLHPILKYAMPLALFLVVGAALMVNSSYNKWNAPNTVDGPALSNDEPFRSAAATGPESSVLPVPSPEVPTPERETVTVPGPQLAAQPRPGRRSSEFVSPPQPTPEGFFRDSAVKPAPTPIIPPEFRNSGNTNTSSSSNSAKPSTEVPSDMVAKPLAVREALESIGIDADLEEKKWKVKSIKENTIAGQMGLKPGDKIESIDGKAIDEKTVYKDGSFRVKTIRVRRGSTAVDLALPKPQ